MLSLCYVFYHIVKDLGCKSFWDVGGHLIFPLFLVRFCSICLEDILKYLLEETVYWINGLFDSSSSIGSFVFLFLFSYKSRYSVDTGYI